MIIGYWNGVQMHLQDVRPGDCGIHLNEVSVLGKSKSQTSEVKEKDVNME